MEKKVENRRRCDLCRCVLDVDQAVPFELEKLDFIRDSFDFPSDRDLEFCYGCRRTLRDVQVRWRREKFRFLIFQTEKKCRTVKIFFSFGFLFVNRKNFLNRKRKATNRSNGKVWSVCWNWTSLRFDFVDRSESKRNLRTSDVDNGGRRFDASHRDKSTPKKSVEKRKTVFLWRRKAKPKSMKWNFPNWSRKVLLVKDFSNEPKKKTRNYGN